MKLDNNLPSIKYVSFFNYLYKAVSLKREYMSILFSFEEGTSYAVKRELLNRYRPQVVHYYYKACLILRPILYHKYMEKGIDACDMEDAFSISANILCSYKTALYSSILEHLFYTLLNKKISNRYKYGKVINLADYIAGAAKRVLREEYLSFVYKEDIEPNEYLGYFFGNGLAVNPATIAEIKITREMFAKDILSKDNAPKNMKYIVYIYTVCKYIYSLFNIKSKAYIDTEYERYAIIHFKHKMEDLGYIQEINKYYNEGEYYRYVIYPTLLQLLLFEAGYILAKASAKELGIYNRYRSRLLANIEKILGVEYGKGKRRPKEYKGISWKQLKEFNAPRKRRLRKTTSSLC